MIAAIAMQPRSKSPAITPLRMRTNSFFVLFAMLTPRFFYAIGNCSKRISPFILLKYRLNGDWRATVSGDTPLFYKNIEKY
jgi:hypothetical protein